MIFLYECFARWLSGVCLIISNLCTCETETVEFGNDTFKNCCFCLLFEFVFNRIVNVDLLIKQRPQQDKKFSGFQILKDKRNYERKKKKRNGWEGRFKNLLNNS